MSEKASDSSEITYLPKSPVLYLSVMRTKEGKPIGIPIWTSFEDRINERSLENESFSATFLSLAKKVSEMVDDVNKDGKKVRITINQRSYNIFVPHPEDELQISFVIVFEEKDTILIKNEYKSELLGVVTETLKTNDKFLEFLAQVDNEQIKPGTALYAELLADISMQIEKWDKKRVKYLEAKNEALKELEQDTIVPVNEEELESSPIESIEGSNLPED